jgi:hypothetical protein
LFWVGERSSYTYTGCSGGFLEIDGNFYCGCIIGRTVMSLFDDSKDGRQKLLRYRKEAGVGNSGGFFLKVFQEDCTGRSPRSRQDNSNEEIRQNRQHYKNIPYYYDVVIGSSDTPGRHVPGQGNLKSSCSDIRTNRSHDTHFNKQSIVEEQNDSYRNILCEIRDEMKKSGMHISDHRDTIYRNKPEYSRKENSGLQESNSSTTDNEKENIQHDLNLNIPHVDRTNIYINSNNYAMNKYHSSLPQEDKIINNSNKPFYKSNFLHKSKTFADKSNVSSGNTENQFRNYKTMSVQQNNHYNILRTITNTSSISEKDKSENITEYCKDIDSDEGKQNISGCSNIRNIDLTSTINMTGKSNFTLNRSKSVDTTTGQQNGNHTATDSGPMQEVTARDRRNVVYSQFTTDRLWSTGEGGCGIWGFHQWPLLVKQYFWKKFPQLLCCQVFEQAAGWIRSPRHPMEYPDNLRLCYR